MPLVDVLFDMEIEGFPLNEDVLIEQIRLIKELGFNGIRMHQKIEDERFYYFCDVMGIMVWCELPSSYEFKDKAVDRIVSEWMQIVKQNYIPIK